MLNLQDSIRQLASNAEAIRALAQTFSDEQAQWKPSPDIWALKEVMRHLYNEERGDFRWHLKTMRGESPPPRQHVAVEDSRQALAGFLAERETSLAWLAALEAPDWEVTTELRFGPSETITLSAGDMLVSWVEHDILHLRQMVELMHAWNEQQAAPYSVRYAGGW
ncbi:MAG: DinB family protein [Chloroflexota bacterium]